MYLFRRPIKLATSSQLTEQPITISSEAPGKPMVEDEKKVDLLGLVTAISEHAGRLGVESVEIDGRVDAVQQRAQERANGITAVVQAVQDLTAANVRIGDEAEEMRATSSEAASAMDSTSATVKVAHHAIVNLAEEVGRIEAKLPEVMEALKQVETVSTTIKGIAAQTNLLALNATIEAARAGDAGKGFAVVAGEVKMLSAQTAGAVAMIQTTITTLTAQVDALVESCRAAVAARSSTGEIGKAAEYLNELGRKMTNVMAKVETITEEAVQNREHCRMIEAEITNVATTTKASLSDIDVIKGRTGSLLAMSEDLIALIAEAGVETVDSQFIQMVVEGAQRVSRIFQDGVRGGDITIRDLFDTDYKPVSGVAPPQYITRHTEFSARRIGPMCNEIVDSSPKIIGCTLGDVNNYYPIINKEFAKPPTADRLWNAANSRARTRQLDRISLSLMKPDKPFLVKTYRRDMGAGRFDLMKNYSAPIFVDGRHWGILRIMVKVS